MELSGSVLESLWEDGEFILSRGVRDGTRSPFLVMSAASAQPALGSVRRLEHAYRLRDELDPAWAVRPLELVQSQGRPALLLEEPGGEVLARLLGQPWEVRAFLHVALGLAGALGQLHARGLVHKDIKPAHILVNPATAEVRVTGFGIASRLPRERPVAEPPAVIAGTLAYMAPEQTGRMNRSVDARSDLYAYGVTLYELLTGALPFAATDPQEWIHCHIARQPVPPSERVNGIPAAISVIVSKLLSKTAEERYQTAAGVEADLRHCLVDWEAHGCIAPFPLGWRGRSPRPWCFLPPTTAATSDTHLIDKEQIKAFAKQFDPQPFHLDAEAAKATLFEGLVASGSYDCKFLSCRLCCPRSAVQLNQFVH